jgi:exonuclease III
MPTADTLPQWLPSVDICKLRENATTVLTSHNIGGLLPHIKDFTTNTINHQSDIIAIQETWICNTTAFRNPLTNHNVYLQTRNYNNIPNIPENLQTAEKGGVSLFIHEDYHCEQILTGNCGIECVAVNITSPDITVYSVYRPLFLPLRYFIQKLTELIKKSPTNRQLVLGDFNVDLLHSPSTSLVTEMNQIGFKQIVTKPTTARNTLIDHIYLKDITPVATGVIPVYYSYHEVTYLSF